MRLSTKAPADTKKKSYMKEFLLIFFLSCVFFAYSSMPSPSSVPTTSPQKTTEMTPENPRQPSSIEMIGNVPSRDQIKQIDYSQQNPSFTMSWGEDENGIGLKGYDPSACNGISSGALPTQIQAMKDNTLWIADGYGPRLVHVSTNGEIMDEILLPELRRPEVPQIPSLIGFTFQITDEKMVYVMDTAQKRILYYSIDGNYRGCFDIAYIFYNPDRLLQVDPFFVVLPGPIFRLQMHIKTDKSRLLSEVEKFPIEDIPDSLLQGFCDIPLQPSSQIGLYVNKVARIISIFDPSQEEAFFSHGMEIKLLSSSAKLSSEKISFQLQQIRYKSMNPHSIATISLQEPHWEGGGILGCDTNGSIYYWVDSHTIGIIKSLHQQSPDIKVQYLRIPDGFLHPVAVIPSGGVVGMRTKKEIIEVVRFIAES